MYSLIATFVKGLRPLNVAYKVIIVTAKKHIQPGRSVLYPRYMFSKRDQESGESVADYVAVLRKLAGSCGFGENKVPLCEMLSDQLVFGIADGVVQQCLLAEKELTFEAAYELAVTVESCACRGAGLPSEDSDVGLASGGGGLQQGGGSRRRRPPFRRHSSGGESGDKQPAVEDRRWSSVSEPPMDPDVTNFGQATMTTVTTREKKMLSLPTLPTISLSTQLRARRKAPDNDNAMQDAVRIGNIEWPQPL
ncbi:hypothetical protein MRX96_059275 [Rhipicephalus microplus]